MNASSPTLFCLRKTALCAAALAAALPAFGHICDDVFLQAKDNLTVRIDVRDGQLRIGREATFKVYLLNTMNWWIEEISLAVISEHFSADVKPDGAWRTYPRLNSAQSGGKKEAFIVTLHRNPGVPDGRYPVRLRLFTGRKEVKTVELSEAEALHNLKPAGGIEADGRLGEEEWRDALLCTDFYEYVWRNVSRGHENVLAREQARFRLAADRENLYCLLHFLGHENAQSDKAVLFLARTPDVEPIALEFDRVTGLAAGPEEIARHIQVRPVAGNDALECAIPRSALGLSGPTLFYFNFIRKTADKTGKRVVTTYWRGNDSSFANPIVYDKISLDF